MKKEKLTTFIDKYNLSGMVDSVLWKIKQNMIFTEFVSDDKTLIGKVMLKNFELDDNEFGIFGTAEMMKMLAPLSDELSMAPVVIDSEIKSIKFADKVFKMNYVVADPEIIPPPAKIKELPEFEIKLDITDEFRDKFLKAKNSISDVNSFAIETQGDEAIFTIGYSTTNTNRISFNFPVESSLDTLPLLFSGEQLKNVLLANKTFKVGVISISSQGLLKISFQGEEFNSEYYLVKLQND